MADNQITPFQLTDQFTMDNFNQRINETNTALQNKAPAGYGLGTTNVNGVSYDANNCTRNGWYNCNVNTPTVAWWYILTVANYGNAVVVQKAWHYNGGKVVECMRLGWLDVSEDQGGGWQPWEWVNPPMKPGVEYRTTERYDERPVYVKVVDVGTTVEGRTVKEHGISNIKNIVRFFGNSSTDKLNFNGLRPMPFIAANSLTNAWTIYVESVDRTEVVVYAGSSVYGAPTRVTVYYTKTAD